LSWVDGAWRDRLVGTANGGAIRLVALEQELTLVYTATPIRITAAGGPSPGKVRLVLYAMSFTAPAG
jgi:hypothetical protein